MTTSRQVGTRWETQVVNYLQERGWKGAERRALAGSADKGDIAGVPGVMFECKAEKSLQLGVYMNEVAAQTVNARADVGVAVVKRRGKGVKDAYAVLPFHAFLDLLKAAGH